MSFIPLAADGWRFILPLLVGGLTFLFIKESWSVVSGIILLLAGGFCAYFFRDFNRATVIDESLIYSPGDGRVLAVEPVQEGPLKGMNLIRIFLSVLDGHVQRSPVQARVDKIIYTKGVFLDARNPNAHFQNERNALRLVSKQGTLIVTQIAGLIARRIVCWSKEGDELKQGQRFGLIRFGSQVDVHVPSNVQISVKPGDRVVGGLTVLGRWSR